MSDNTQLEIVKQNNSEDRHILVSYGPDSHDSIDISNLTVKTPGKGEVLVKDVSLSLKRGDRVVLRGESGTGKTTVAKALLNQWDHGTGSIVMPPNMTMMMMSQNVSMPNTTLENILNGDLNEDEHYDEEHLKSVLKRVDHKRLLQHIPGLQVEELMDSLLKNLKDILIEQYQKKRLNLKDTEDITNILLPVIRQLVDEQFDVVQYTQEKQKRDFRHKLAHLLATQLKFPVKRKVTSYIAEHIIDHIDTALIKPLNDKFNASAADIAKNKRGKLIKYTEVQSDLFQKRLETSLERRLHKYMANKDTDDPKREIRINKQQAAHVTRALGQSVRSEMQQYSRKGILRSLFGSAARKNRERELSKPTKKMPAPLKGLFNIAANLYKTVSNWDIMRTDPLSYALIRMRAASAAKKQIQAVEFFLAQHVVTGDMFMNRLSGGEKQRLMFARILLHKPDILILDEITAALDEENGKKLYEDMMKQLPEGTIVLSIAHNKHIVEYHTRCAVLEDQTLKIENLRESKTAEKDKKEGPKPPAQK